MSVDALRWDFIFNFAIIISGVRQSKFKHLSCNVQHKSKHIDNIRRLSTRVPGESDMFHVNNKRCVLPIDGAGGLLAVLEVIFMFLYFHNH